MRIDTVRYVPLRNHGSDQAVDGDRVHRWMQLTGFDEYHRHLEASEAVESDKDET